MNRKMFYLRKVAAIAACLAVMTIMFQGCITEDSTPKNITVTGGQTDQTVYADEQSGSGGVSFTTTGAWTSNITASAAAKAPAEQGISRAPSNSPDWISINPDHGDAAGTYTITITLLPNGTGANRTATIIISCDGTEVTITVTQKGESNGVEPVELKSPITTNTTLKDLGLPIDYYFNDGSSLTVKDNAVLTIDPGVTIQFRQANGSLYIWTGATIKANGTAAKPIQFVGPTETKGSWQGVEINNTNNNELNYVQILNAGGQGYDQSAALFVDNGNVSMTNCLINNSLTYGITFGSSSSGSYRSEFTKFSNNTISNCGKAPIRTYTYADCYNLRNIDKTNTFTGNVNEYIYIPATTIGNIYADMTLPALNGYPWYLEAGISMDDPRELTIEPGATLLMGAASRIYVRTGSHLIANGTATARITFKGFKNNAGYWAGILLESESPGSKLNYCDLSGGGAAGAYVKDLLHMDSGSVNTYLELNNTTFSNCLHHGMLLESYWTNSVTRQSNCVISCANPASVTFSNCTDGNIYSSSCVAYTLVVYNTLAETCNLY